MSNDNIDILGEDERNEFEHVEDPDQPVRQSRQLAKVLRSIRSLRVWLHRRLQAAESLVTFDRGLTRPSSHTAEQLVKAKDDLLDTLQKLQEGFGQPEGGC